MRVTFEPDDEEWLVALIARALERAQPAPAGAQEWMTTSEVAEHLRTSEATLYYWRRLSKGPAGVRRGRRVLYRRADVDAWINNKKEDRS